MDYKSVNKEKFYDLQLAIKGTKDLQSALKAYTDAEVMDGDNLYLAGDLGLQEAIKGTEFLSFPPIFNIHLMRFVYDAKAGGLKKVNDKFSFPETLDIAELLGKPEVSINILLFIFHLEQ